MSDLIEQWSREPIPMPKEKLIYPTALESGEELVDITQEDRIVYTAFYRREMGLKNGLARCYVRKGAAEKLKKVLEVLPEEYSLMIYDALRPVTVQQELYDLYSAQLRKDHPDMDEAALLDLIDDFVAFPRIDRQRPTPHSTGGAIDLTLMKEGKEVDMGTGFDDLTDMAHTNFFELLQKEQTLTQKQQEALKNRRILYHAMTQAGFANFRGEWWHYSYGDRAWSAQTGNPVIYSYMEP